VSSKSLRTSELDIYGDVTEEKYLHDMVSTKKLKDVSITLQFGGKQSEIQLNMA